MTTSDKSRKSRFTWNILVLTVLLIGFGTLVFMTGMYLVLEGITVQRLGMLIIGVGLTAVVIRQMSILNRKEIEHRKEATEKDHHEYITEWSINPQQWKAFLKAKLDFDLSDAKGYGYAVGGVMTLVAGIIAVSVLTVKESFIIVLSTFIVFFFIGKYGARIAARRNYKSLSTLDSGKVSFAKDVIVYNGELILLTGFGQALRYIKKEERFDMGVFVFSVHSGFGNRKNVKEYTIPIPAGGDTEATRLQDYYSGLVQ